MGLYQKEAFDITKDFKDVWEKFLALKPANMKKSAFIRKAIEEYVKKHHAISKRKERG